jgi:heterodisulfide reductase subunit B
MTGNRHTYPYYPGCSLQHGNHAYEVSTKAIAQALGFELAEMDDWNCCGATEYFSVENRLPAYALVARNLARAADEGATELVVPCSACFLNLFKTDKHMKKYPDLGAKVNKALAAGNLSYDPGSHRITAAWLRDPIPSSTVPNSRHRWIACWRRSVQKSRTSR